jgi:UDP-N-acetylglucosamine 1-carboxyvinyltransferase
MDYLQIQGQAPLGGTVNISGAKNSALPLIASTILASNEVVISNMPNVVDVKTLMQLLKNLGGDFSFDKNNNKAILNTAKLNKTQATYDIVKKMRASILVLGPLLARFGHCEVSLPGGCAIGQRPVDLHLKALELMGASIKIQSGYIIAKAKNGLCGATIVFDKISVTGSENIIMAGALANGVTKIINAAKEPEVVQLCKVLKDAGVNIQGEGTNEITIVGTNGALLKFKPFSIIADRIEAGTYLCVGAINNSKMILNNCNPHHLGAVIAKMKEIGFKLECLNKEQKIILHPISKDEFAKLKPFHIITNEYPGFPTDLQAQFMALALNINGVSVIDERLFENRFMHVSELNRMGANISLSGTTANVVGGHKLRGADVMATDLRASSALIIAGLIAKGITKVHRIYHLDRGYDNLEGKLKAIGANICKGVEKVEQN